MKFGEKKNKERNPNNSYKNTPKSSPIFQVLLYLCYLIIITVFKEREDKEVIMDFSFLFLEK